jgi:hypothetical protein
MRDKKKTISVKVRDLKPKKDAKGGMVANTSTKTRTNVGTSGHSVQGGGRQTSLHI